MKTLLLMRHAKSDWNAAYAGDHERPLNDRGRRAAAAMGRWLRRTEQAPEAIVTSSALRARHTVELAAAAGDWDCGVDVERALYGADARTVMRIASRTDDGVDRLLVAGHEPGIPLTVSCLLGDVPLRFPTAAAARIDLAIETWSAVQPAVGCLLWFVSPRLLKPAD